MNVINYIIEYVFPLITSLVFMPLAISLFVFPITFLVWGIKKTIKAKKTHLSVAKPIFVTVVLEIANVVLFVGSVYLMSRGGENLRQDIGMCVLAIIFLGTFQIVTVGLPIFGIVFGLCKTIALKRKEALRRKHVLAWIAIGIILVAISIIILSHTGMIETLRGDAIDYGIIKGEL
ncbi:MAG: hypothetical protein FWH26_04495 [Oscillospiraceae bacterium]|nr:hypothetical protein [Oscillospiraceae bacterium]